jgi:hypothetical protein
MEASSFLQEKEQKHNNPVGPTNFWLWNSPSTRPVPLERAGQGHSRMAKMTKFLFLITAAALSARAADQTTARLDKAAAVFAKLTTLPHGIRPEQIDSADCIAVVPGFKKGAEKIDIVILSTDRSRRPKLLSDRFAIASDAAAAWGNGKAAHGDPNAQILFFGSTKGAFAGFGLDGATIKWDESGDKALYGKPITNTVIVNGGTPTPEIAEAFHSKLGQGSNR